MGITSQEIAKIAKVSGSTVSRVINNYPKRLPRPAGDGSFSPAGRSSLFVMLTV